jgi:hypothetical protein
METTQESEESSYEPPVLVDLGEVDQVTQGAPGGPNPDALNPNHNFLDS